LPARLLIDAGAVAASPLRRGFEHLRCGHTHKLGPADRLIDQQLSEGVQVGGRQVTGRQDIECGA
jgi:hypothetical protein